MSEEGRKRGREGGKDAHVREGGREEWRLIGGKRGSFMGGGGLWDGGRRGGWML